MTSEEFATRYPEFLDAPADLVDAVLLEADLWTADSWGDRRETVVGLMAAKLLADSPFARNARLLAPEGGGRTTVANPYQARLNELTLSHGWARNRT